MVASLKHMATEPETDARPESKRHELDALRRRVEALERDRVEQAARANAAIAAAQDRSYWLDRWGVDLNALMRRRGASELRAGFRALRAMYRPVRSAARELRGAPLRLRIARSRVAEERITDTAAGDQDRFRRTISPDRLRATPVTDLFYDRLEKEDVAAVVTRLEPPEAALFETAEPADRKRLALAFAAHYEVQPALERSGLNSAMPPPDVHSMARSPAAAGGSTYYADLVVDALEQTGLDAGRGGVGLDFGCSSGRVVRVLASALPEVDWHGCDPISDAIDWARGNLPGISFNQSPEYPPLAYADGYFDFAFAISIWSHFSERAAVDWLREMARIVMPGGKLVLTTHGYQTIAHTHAQQLRSVEQLTEVSQALYQSGFWYAPEFGEQGDHGVANPDWGTAFLSPEWLLARSTPEWSVGLFAPGRVEENQDLYVLERR
jgi:SAM-dependent methyltransferase